MRNLSLLVWLTQLAFSVVCPLGGFILLGVWLHQSCHWGQWVVFVGIALGLVTAITGLRAGLKTMGLLAREDTPPPPLSFNDHE